MITAVDSSALIAILKGESSAESWFNILLHQAKLGQLIICDVVAAEIAGLFNSLGDLSAKLEALEISLTQTRLNTAFFAGSVFQQYRRQGGPRVHLIPDFLIAAHAVKQADCLVTLDRGYLRKYFSSLKLIKPGV